MSAISNAGPEPSASVARTGVARLVFVEGAQAGTIVDLTAQSLVLGRSTRADLTIDRRTVSQRHATITATPEGHVIEDLGSTNGTYVDGQRVERALLRPGHRLRLGDVEILYDDGTGITTMLPFAGTTALVDRGMAHVFVPQPEPNAIDRLLQIHAFLRKHGRMMLVLALVGLALGSASLSLIPPLHTASFTLTVNTLPQNNPLEYRPRESLSFFRDPQVRFVRPGLVRATLEALGDDDVTDREIGFARARLQLARNSSASQLYDGAFEHVDPVYAVEFLREHLHQYLESEVAEGIEVVSNEEQALAAQLRETHAELEATERAIFELKQEHPQELPETAEGLFDQVTNLTVDHRAAASALTAAEAGVTVARRRLADESRRMAVKLDRALPYENELTTVEKLLVVAESSGKGGSHPEVMALRDQAARLEQLREEAMEESLVVERVTSVRDQAAREGLAAAKATLEVARKEYARSAAALAEARRHLERMPAVEREYAELTRNQTTLKERYEDVLTKLGHVQTQLALETAAARARVDVVHPPAVEPGARNRALYLRGGLATVLGLVLALIVATIREVGKLLAARQQALVLR